jgi:PAS domain S-box-containing protein
MHNLRLRPDFEALFAATPTLLVVLLPDQPGYTIVAASEAYARATMTRREDIVGRSIFDVFPDNPADPLADGATNLRAALDRVVQTREPIERAAQKYDIRRPVESGGAFEERWWRASCTPVFTADGKLAWILHVIEDITERRRSELALSRSEAQFRAIIERMPDGVLFHRRGRIGYANRALAHLLGYDDPAALLGRHVFDLVHPDDVSVVAQRIERLEEGRLVPPQEMRALRRDQSLCYIETTGIPMSLEDQYGVLVIVRDLTERRRVEKEQQLLTESGAVLGATLDYEQTLATVAELVTRDFADWCVVEVMEERAQLRRLKVASADPTQLSLCRELERMPVDRGRPYLISVVIETKEPLIIERVTTVQLEWGAQDAEHLRLLQAINPVSLMALPLLMRGQLLGTICFISSRESLIYGAADLRVAQSLAERAAVAIENARLYSASVQAAQLRDQVLSVVAHDLRNPLATIRLQAQGMVRPPPDPERRSQRAREVIDRAAARMNRLIQDLLDVARMEAGQLTLERARLAAAELTAEATELQRPLAISSSLELRLELAPDLPELWGDRHRLLQVFENLIGNAIKFTPPGGRITVGAAPHNGAVVFSVADTGRGIGPDGLPRVFDRFWQAMRADRQGAGLGLPITKGIVEAHGGRIWVESALGRGSTFFFSIGNPG